ncbi:MAG: hypothetical protein EU544_02710 [Promethearchaeota archaeon]|nr:MAG: hypothetical protein EU544_02710 [Candidatus Lokiarchaeota archaeon]
MRNIIFLLTEDLNFFYRINKELKSLGIKFKIRNFRDKIPNFPSIIITTTKEIDKLPSFNKEKVVLIPYDGKESLKRYVLKILAAYEIEYKDQYSQLLFSVDPGTKKSGLTIFLERYYLYSHTVYNKSELIDKINLYVQAFQKEGTEELFLVFKIGRGLIDLARDLVEDLLVQYKNRENIKFYLIDETKSSKLKIHEKKHHFSKHETSALVLALRDGIEVTCENYKLTFRIIKEKKIRKKKFKTNILNNSNNNTKKYFSTLRDIAEKLLDRELTLDDSKERLENCNLKKMT